MNELALAGHNMYHLNPDLVPDYANIRVCDNCMPDPRRNTFTIASGGVTCPISAMSPKLVCNQFVVLAWSCRCPVNILQVTSSIFSQMALLSVPPVSHELVKNVFHV